jgi:hypothetical protein
MINGKRIAVVMPAYNAAKTLERTVRELPEKVDFKSRTYSRPHPQGADDVRRSPPPLAKLR